MRELGSLRQWATCFALVLAAAAAASRRTDIYFAGFFPMTTSTGAGIGPGVMPAVRLAIKHINESPAVLRGYKLHMYWNDTQCNPGVGLKAFFDMVHLKPKKLVLFGAACSPVTDQIAKAAKHWNLVQLTYADTHPMFTAKSFPHFFRVVPSDNEFNPPRLSIMKYYNWTRVGTLYQNEAKYALSHNHLVSELERNNFTIVESQSFNDEITNQLEMLVDRDIRIILGNFNETWARVIFCEAYRRGIYGHKYQWLIIGMYQDNWWEKGGPEAASCTPHQIKLALVGTMVMDILPLASREEITISKRTPEEYEAEYLNVTKFPSRYHGYAYDGIWATALALQEAGRQAELRLNATLADFDYRDKSWERLFIGALGKTSFEGVTGAVRFKQNSRRGNIVIKQVVAHQGDPERMTEKCIGEYSGVTRTLYLERCGKVFWAAGRAPKDREIIIIEEARIDITIYAGLVTIACCGILLATAFLIINIKFRNQRQIKMSSPNLNNLIIIGCILTYTSVVLLGLDSHLTSVEAFPYVCTSRAWILMSGFTLSFGSMFSKTWRVHSIFTNVQLNKKVMKDSQLYLVIVMLFCMDVIIMTTWQIVDPFYRETKELEPYSLDMGDGVQIIPRMEYCVSSHMSVFVGCIYAYKGLLMLFGAFLAWETRNVQIPALNDSKYVGMSVYNVAIMCVLGVAVSFVLKNQVNASFVIIAVFIIFSSTGTLCLVFVPKIIDLRKDPHGTMDRRGKINIRTNVHKKAPLQTMEDKLRIASNVNRKYRELLNDLDAELEEAARELGEEEAEALLESRFLASAGSEGKKEAHVSFAVDIHSSSTERPSTQNEESRVVSNRNANEKLSIILHAPPGSSPTPVAPSRTGGQGNVSATRSGGRRPANSTSSATTTSAELCSTNTKAWSMTTKNPREDRQKASAAALCRRLSGSEEIEGKGATYEDHATQTDDDDDGVDYQPRRTMDEYLAKTCSLRYPPKGSAGGECANCCPYNVSRRGHSQQAPSKSSHDITAADSAEILPIFHKLIEDKQQSSGSTLEGGGHKASSDRRPASSCPDISVRCDIVEYL